MKRSTLVPALASLFGIAALAAAAAFAAAQTQSPAPDQRRTVAGWLVEDGPAPVAEGDDMQMDANASDMDMGMANMSMTDEEAAEMRNALAMNTMSASDGYADAPVDRRIVMSRTSGAHRLSYELYTSSAGWMGSYDANSNGCFSMFGLEVEGEFPPAERPRRTRAALLRALQEHERRCEEPPGSTTALLDGFEPAFALLSTWYEQRMAEHAAYWAHADPGNTLNGMDDVFNAN